MPRGTPKEETELLECLAMLRKTLKYRDYNDLPYEEILEYWERSENVLRRLCIEGREAVLQTFMKARRSIREFSHWWPCDDVSKSMLKGRLLMLKVEKGKEKHWQDHFELTDVKEIREMLSRKKFQKKTPAIEYVEIFQSEFDENTKRIVELNRTTQNITKIEGLRAP